MASNGKLEARITVPVGGWSFDITEVPANSATITVPAGTYYHSTADSAAEGLRDTIITAILAAVGDSDLDGDYDVLLGAGENGTGKYTIQSTAAITSFSIAWTSSVLKALLGFTSTPSGALTYTGENHCQGLWLPSYGHQKKNGGVGGGWVTDQQNAKNSAGYVYSVMGQKHRQTALRWPQEKRNKCWAENEVATSLNESFEQFLIDGIWGEAAWGTSAGPIRFHADAAADDAYGTFSVLGMENWSPEEMQTHWTGRWVIDLPNLIEVPGSRIDAAEPEPEPVVYALNELTPASVATITGQVAPTLMWLGKDASGATELVSGTDNFTDVGAPGKETLDAALDGHTTEFLATGDAMAAAGSTVGDADDTQSITFIFITRPTTMSAGDLFGKREVAGANLGYELTTTAGGFVTWVCDVGAGGGNANTVSVDHGTVNAQVFAMTRQIPSNLQGLWSREGSSTGSRVVATMVNTALLEMGSNRIAGTLQNFGACMCWIGVGAEFGVAADFEAARLAVAQHLGYE